MAAVGPVPMTLGGRQNQLEYLLQGSTNKNSVTNLLHRLRGLCDNPAPIELGEREKLGETFSDHEIVYALRSGNNSVTLRARRSLDDATAPWQLRYVGPAEMGDKSRASLVRSCVEVLTSDNLTSFLEELGFRVECEYILKGYYFYKGHIRILVSQVYKTVNPYPFDTSEDEPRRHTPSDAKELKLLVITVATDETDGYKRFMKSCKHFNFNVKVLGMDQDWRGGDIARYPGGGQKINILKNETVKYKDDKNLLVMFVDSYDVIMLAPPEEIISKFLEFEAKMIVSAEGFCWPNKWLADKYPGIQHGKRFLCSGGIIGYAPVFHAVVTDSEVADTDDDQLYYTNIYLDMEKREKFAMKLDHRAEIFMNLNGAKEEVELKFDDNKVTLWNKEYNTGPLVLHGNGPSKLFLNYLGNYVPDQWNMKDGCLSCDDDVFLMEDIKEEDYPTVTVALFVEQPTPFLPEFFQKIMNQAYPKKKINLFVHNSAEYHEKHVIEWLTEETIALYQSVKYIPSKDKMEEVQARNMAIDECLENKCDYLFSVDSSVSLTNNYTLRLLIEQNRTVIAPKLSKHEKLWSNFWGAVSDDGFYQRNPDYIDIVNGKRRGVWNSPFITAAYLIKKEVLPKVKNSYGHHTFDPDMAFCQFLRNRGIFMFVTNLYYFGHLKEMDTYTTNHIHNEMWQIIDNKLDWEEKYLHPLYYQSLNNSHHIEQPCPDVYWFPLFKESYAQHLIEEMEHFGQWSGGTNVDKRLATGYENVPTVDIHMNQIGYDKEWLYFLKQYVTPLCHRVYPGYHSEARAVMNFVVKYNPAGQYYLRPHHDSSTYTINVALSRPGVDYGGGGCNFLRYNCKVTQTRVGWTFMHPGRLTHYHEGLPVTWGTRYIMVSFIDP